MDIYTGRGDGGKTDLRDMSRVSKTDVRIEAYGVVDELNGILGVVRPTEYDDVDAWLHTVQNHLHIIQAELACPDGGENETITDKHIEKVESWIDASDAELPSLEAFILPTGSPSGSRLHHARSVCRRAERRAVALAERDGCSPSVLQYLNRLSDALFVWARLVNDRDGEVEESPTY